MRSRYPAELPERIYSGVVAIKMANARNFIFQEDGD